MRRPLVLAAANFWVGPLLLVSFVMFAPLAGIVGGLGGYAARKRAATSVA